MSYGKWPDKCVQRAFVDGVKWWHYQQLGNTMFSSEVAEAEAEAVKKYGDPLLPREVKAHDKNDERKII